MLNTQKVLNHVKLNLGYPFKGVEHSDNTILNYIRTTSLIEFSEYIPDRNMIHITQDNLVQNSKNLYILNDPDERDIITVVNVVPEMPNLLMVGHPWLQIPSNLSQVENIIMGSQDARLKYTYSPLSKTWEFIPPNKLYLYPSYFSTVYGIRYERTHDKNFFSIPPKFEILFLKLCVADTLDLIASIREQYSEWNTPFGNIPLNADVLRNRSNDLKTEVKEKLSSIPPNIIVEVY